MERLLGSALKSMFVSGANSLANNFQTIDALNVFPVPDGDTGTNMNLTFSSGVKDIVEYRSEHVGDICKVLSKGLLMGARGNSGVILSQIFRGFYQAVDGKDEIDALTFARAFVKGSEIAYKAVMRPVEGTILTVIREASANTLQYVENEQIIDITKVIVHLVEEAKISLEKTPDLLPVLKEVGVVDSGGAGLVKILEGFSAALHGNPIALAEGAQTQTAAGAKMESDEFGYCTEFIVRLNSNTINTFNEDKFKKQLSRIGESIVVVQDDDIFKVHVHTLMPGEALNMAQRYGEFVKLKIENMQEQHDHLSMTQQAEAPVAKKAKYGLIAVAAGEGLATYFKELRVDIVVSGGQTMNPSTEDFVAAVQKLNAEHIIILPNNSNIILAAQQAVDVLDTVDIRVIPTKSIPQGIASCIMFNPDVDIEMNVSEMTEALGRVQTGQVTYAIKDTTFDGLQINANDYMGIMEKNIVVSMPDKMLVTKTLLDSMMSQDVDLVTIISGEDVSEDECNEIVSYVENIHGAEVEVIEGKQPVYSFFIGIE